MIQKEVEEAVSKYTTGEMAKLCDVTVRTVQYYDTRKILVPSELSEGGRRLYSEADLRKLKIICFLRNMGLSIDNITRILAEENSSNVISVLLGEQARMLKSDIAQQQARLQAVEQLRQEMKSWSNYSVENLHDIATVMENRKKLRRIHTIMVVAGVFMDVIEIGTLLLGILKGIWLPFFIGMPLVILCGLLIFKSYYKYTAYICPGCHSIFKPGRKEFFFSGHTPWTRKLTCKNCGVKGFCVETYFDAT